MCSTSCNEEINFGRVPKLDIPSVSGIVPEIYGYTRPEGKGKTGGGSEEGDPVMPDLGDRGTEKRLYVPYEGGVSRRELLRRLRGRGLEKSRKKE